MIADCRMQIADLVSGQINLESLISSLESSIMSITARLSTALADRKPRTAPKRTDMTDGVW